MNAQGNTPTPARARRGTKAFAIAIAAGQFCALVRYTILARILGPAELGLAVTIVLTAQFFDSITDSGNDRFLIQDIEGDQPRAQKLVQLVALSRGIFIALALFLFAHPIAAFYKTPALVTGLMILAVAPLVSGLIHLDLRRMQRHHDFRIEGRAILCAELASLATTTIAAIVTRSFLAIVFGLIVRAAVLVVISHLMAERRYAVHYSREFARRLFIFGAPLMINGLLLFFGSQSDRLLIGKYLGLAELGKYSTVLLLIYYPIMVLQRFVAGLYLPQVATGAPMRTQASDELGGVTLIISIVTTMGFALVAPFATIILFGPRFAHSLTVIGLVGVLNTARFMRLWPVNLALGAGRSDVVLANNLARLIAIPVGIACALHFRTLDSIVIGFIAGEFIALGVGLALLNRALNRRMTADFGRIALFASASMAVLFGTWGIEHESATALITAVIAAVTTGIILPLRERRMLTLALSLAGRIGKPRTT